MKLPTTNRALQIALEDAEQHYNLSLKQSGQVLESLSNLQYELQQMSTPEEKAAMQAKVENMVHQQAKAIQLSEIWERKIKELEEKYNAAQAANKQAELPANPVGYKSFRDYPEEEKKSARFPALYVPEGKSVNEVYTRAQIEEHATTLQEIMIRPGRDRKKYDFASLSA